MRKLKEKNRQLKKHYVEAQAKDVIVAGALAKNAKAPRRRDVT
jgi:hypothetical protein